MVIVGDDCALPDAGLAGRRGLAGAVLVLKVTLYSIHRHLLNKRQMDKLKLPVGPEAQ